MVPGIESLFENNLTPRVQRFHCIRPAWLLWLACLLLAGAAGAEENFSCEVWTLERGLPDSSVSSIAQTPDGYLWVGTYNGLARFDGVDFTTFDPGNTPAHWPHWPQKGLPMMMTDGSAKFGKFSPTIFNGMVTSLNGTGPYGALQYDSMLNDLRNNN